MPIAQFSREKFELNLPNHKVTGAQLWKPRGLVDGEYAYWIEVKPEVAIEVRSSVGVNGNSASCGENSIRCWLVWTNTGSPAGSKLSRWITRKAGWHRRLRETLQQLYRVGRHVGACSCGKLTGVYRVKKKGPNHGRWFTRCQCGKFAWLPLATRSSL